MVTNLSPRWRALLLALGAIRGAIAVLAIPLAPVLYEKHFVVLVLLRPTKDVLLFGGFLARLGKVHPIPLVAAAIPLSLFAVWHVYFIGRHYREQIESDDLPRWSRRFLRPDRIKTMQRLLDRKGPLLIFLARLAPFPSSVLGIAAGSGGMNPRTFFPVDAAGGLVAIAASVGAGWLFGAAYKEAGPWITGVGIGMLVAVGLIVGRFLRRDVNGARTRRVASRSSGR